MRGPKRLVQRFLSAQNHVDLVALIKDEGLVKATDMVQRAQNPNFWRIPGPYKLYLLKDVPLDLAEKLVDHGEKRGFRFKSNREAWVRAYPFAIRRPIMVQP